MSGRIKCDFRSVYLNFLRKFNRLNFALKSPERHKSGGGFCGIDLILFIPRNVIGVAVGDKNSVHICITRVNANLEFGQNNSMT